MDVLYLIRRNNAQILGPFSSVGIIQAMGRLEFGRQDEICGSFRPWVALDSANLRKIYPEIYRLLNYSASESMQEIAASSHFSSLKVIFLFVSLTALIAAILLIGGGRRYIFLLEKRIAIALYNSEAYDSIDWLLPKISTMELTEDNEWLPFIRLSYFKHLKSDYIPNELEKSSLLFSNQKKCTSEQYEEMFRNSVGQWSFAFFQYQNSKEAWYRMLFLNPHILKQQKEDGWLFPANEEAACVVLASLVFERLSLDNSFLSDVEAKESALGLNIMADILKRLRWQRQIILDENIDDAFMVNDGSILFYLSCMEKAKNQKELSGCFPDVATHGENWVLFFKQRFLLEQIRFIKNRKKLSIKEVEYLQFEVENLPTKDVFIDFKYDKEFEFLSEIIKGNGDVKSVQDKVRSGVFRKD